MKKCLCCLLCFSSILWSPSVLAEGSILIEPFPSYSEAHPLVVESPVTLQWHQGRSLRVAIRSDDGQVFPRNAEEGVLDSGVTFLLDPGAYEIRISETRGSERAEKPVVVHIYVPRAPQTIDIRGDGPAVNVQMREVRDLLVEAKAHDQRQAERTAAMEDSLGQIRSQIEGLSQQLADLQEDVGVLLAQFIVTELSEDGTPQVVVQPLQRMYDHVKSLEAPPEENPGKR